LEGHLDTWCELKHPNITDFLGLSYDVPFPAAIILPYYSKGNSLEFVKREKNADVLNLVRLLLLVKIIYSLIIYSLLHMDDRSKELRED
jgi:hypothetical protein